MDLDDITVTAKPVAEMKSGWSDISPADIKKIVEIKSYNPKDVADQYTESAGLVAKNWIEENKNLLMYAAIGFVAWKLLK